MTRCDTGLGLLGRFLCRFLAFPRPRALGPIGIPSRIPCLQLHFHIQYAVPPCPRAGRDLGPVACSALLHACAQDRDLRLAWQLFDDMQAAKVCVHVYFLLGVREGAIDIGGCRAWKLFDDVQACKLCMRVACVLTDVVLTPVHGGEKAGTRSSLYAERDHEGDLEAVLVGLIPGARVPTPGPQGNRLVCRMYVILRKTVILTTTWRRHCAG